MNERLQNVISRLSNVTGCNGQYEARCPCHEDLQNSLCLSEADDGKVLLTCQAGCETADIIAAAGLKWADLFPPTDNGRPRIVATYDYRDESGNLLFQSVRKQPKKFAQRKPDGKGGWEWRLNGVRRVLYRLPELLAADPRQTVFVAEGEKDVDRLFGLGLVATCNPQGAGKWRADYNGPLKGRAVVIIEDNDTAGRDHVQAVAESLNGVADSVRVLRLPGLPKGGDVSDWLDTGGTKDGLLKLAEQATPWDPAPVADQNDVPEPLSIAKLVETHPQLKPVLIDGIARAGETINIIAPSKIGKSWLSYSLALDIATGGDWLDTFPVHRGRVLIIDNELHPETIAHRIPVVAAAKALADNLYCDRIDVISLRGRLVDFYDLRPFVEKLQPGHYSAVVVDAYYRMLPAGTSENANAEIAAVYNLIDQYAELTGASWFLIHHATKGGQSEKRVTDVGAGAGSQSRAADTHLILREHEEPDCVVLDAAVRSFPPVDRMALQWTFPVWTPADHLDPDKLKRQPTRQDQRQDDRDREGIREIVDALLQGPATTREIRRRTGIGKARVERLLDLMERDRHLTRHDTTVAGNRTHEYLLTDGEGGGT